MYGRRPWEPPPPEPATLDVFVRPEWQKRAACRGVGPEMFFLGQGGDHRPAEAMCATCTVRAECLDFATATTTGNFGMWGGLSNKRVQLERRRRRLAEAS